MGKTKKITLTSCLLFSLFSIICVAQDDIIVDSNSAGSVQYTVQKAIAKTHVFTLFGDGHFAIDDSPSHEFEENTSGYTTTSYFVKPYNPNKPPKKSVNTGGVTAGAGANISKNFTGPSDILISWQVADGKDNFYILAFKNSTDQNSIDGCVEFHFDSNNTVPNMSNIIERPDWVHTRTTGSSSITGCDKKIAWEFDDLDPGEERFVYIPATNLVAAGKKLTLYSKFAVDCEGGTTSGSSFNSYRYSHDPNTKRSNLECLVYPADRQRITYDISFYNDGNGPAHNIIVTDLLEHTLDPTSIELIDFESVEPIITVSGQHLTFEFPGIELPGINQKDGPVTYTTEDCTSQFSFSVCTIDPIYQDMCIYNLAKITFDSNPPIITNIDTLCNIEQCSDLSPCMEDKSSDFSEDKNLTANIDDLVSFDVAPNPFSNQVLIDVNFSPKTTGTCTIDLIDFSGKRVRQLYQNVDIEENIHQQFNLDDLPKGIYLLILSTSDNNRYTKKIIKQ